MTQPSKEGLSDPQRQKAAHSEDVLQALRESQERYRSLYEALPVAAFVCDRNAVIQNYNTRAVELWGRAPQVGVERYCGSVKLWLPNGTLLPHAQSPMMDVLRTGIACRNVEVSVERPDGSRLPVLVNFCALKNAQEEVVGVVTSFDDITERKQMEEALRESEARKSAMVSSALDAIITMDHEGKIVEFNPAAEIIFGYQREEVIGQPMDQLIIPPSYQERHRRGLAHYLATGEGPVLGQRLELPGRRADGSEFSTELTIKRLPSAGPPMFTGFIRDISERKQTQETLANSEVRYRRLFETAQDAILLLDADSGKITDVNPFTQRLLGYSLDEIRGRELWEIGVFSDKSANEVAFRELKQNGTIRFDHLPLETKSGERVEVEFVSNVYRMDHTLVIQCNIRDFTERRRLEKQTHDQAAALSNLHRRKDEFLAMLSHELRNPLAPIANAVQLLRLQKNEDQLQQQARSIIERQLGQMTRLIDDLLEVSRVTTGRIHLQQECLDLRTIVERSLETVGPAISHRAHVLTVRLPPEPIWVHADATRLEQVAVNLLNNAAKYSNPHSHIWLGLEQEGAEAVLRVHDSGIGIAPDVLPHIFDLFTQAGRSLDRAEGGLGIGLALVKELVTMHGGTVEAHSTLGHGSKFIIRLPISDCRSPIEAEEDNTNRKSAIENRKFLRVLVVDDNVDAAESLAVLLQQAGHETRIAYDGPTALQAALDDQPDIVLLDIGLPGLNGYEVAKRIRKEPALKDIVLVASTGYGQESDQKKSLAAGFNHHLIKPFPFNTLEQIFEAVAKKAT